MSKGGKDKTALAPKQLNDLMAGLQKYDGHIPDKYIREITAFGNKAIPHLENILKEVLGNQDRINLNQPAKSTEIFKVVHAFNLLAHLGASESLKTVIEFLSQEEKYLDYWLDDVFDEDLWEILFELGKNNITDLKYFLLNKKINEFQRLAAARALVQIALHDKSKTEDVRNIFHTLLILEDENNDFIGLVISELLDWRDEPLKAIILKKLNEVDVYEGIITAEEVQYLYTKRKRPFIRKPQNIFERYARYREALHFGTKGRKKSAKIIRDIKVEKTSKSDFKL